MGWLATIDSGVRIDSDIRRKIRESSSKPETKRVASQLYVLVPRCDSRQPNIELARGKKNF